MNNGPLFYLANGLWWSKFSSESGWQLRPALSQRHFCLSSTGHWAWVHSWCACKLQEKFKNRLWLSTKFQSSLKTQSQYTCCKSTSTPGFACQACHTINSEHGNGMNFCQGCLILFQVQKVSGDHIWIRKLRSFCIH